MYISIYVCMSNWKSIAIQTAATKFPSALPPCAMLRTTCNTSRRLAKRNWALLSTRCGPSFEASCCQRRLQLVPWGSSDWLPLKKLQVKVVESKPIKKIHKRSQKTEMVLLSMYRCDSSILKLGGIWALPWQNDTIYFWGSLGLGMQLPRWKSP